VVLQSILFGKKGRVDKHDKLLYPKNKKIIIPIRDARNVCISIRKTLILDYYSDSNKSDININNLNFVDNKHCVDQLKIMVGLYQKYKNDENSLILKYEDIYPNGLGDYKYVVKKLCGFLDIKYTSELQLKVDEILDFDKLKSISSKMDTFKKNDMSNSSYGLHGNHINSDNISYWKEVIPKKFHDELNKKLDVYLKDLNYN